MWGAHAICSLAQRPALIGYPLLINLLWAAQLTVTPPGGATERRAVLRHVLKDGPRPLKPAGRHGHFLILQGEMTIGDTNIGSSNIVTWDIGYFLISTCDMVETCDIDI